MRLATIGGAAAFVLASVIVGCSDQPGSPSAAITAPRSGMRDGSRFRLQGIGSVNIRTANGVIARALPGWTATGTMRDGVVSDESGSSPLGVIAVSASIVKPNGSDRQSSFTDAAGNHLTVAFYGGANGAPVRAMRLYRNGTLESATDYDWASAAGGWVLRSVTRVDLHDGQVVSRIHVSASGAAEVASRGAAADALAHLSAAAAQAVAPRDLSAQDILSGKCRKQALDYYAAEAALSAALVAFTRAPSYVTALLVAAASAKATSCEMAYWICLQNQESQQNPIGQPPPGPVICGNTTTVDPFCSPPDQQ